MSLEVPSASQLPSKSNFSEWYNEMLFMGEIMDVRFPVKGLYVWFPFGFALRNRMYGLLKSLLDKDHQETLFPLLIPKNVFMKEAEHIKGFEDEVYWVTRGGVEELDVPLALRPTSETAIYPMFKLWIRSHADLPLRVYQIVNTFRYETKHTRPLIRLREITSFKEAHTAHATWEDAAEQVEEAIRIYREFYHRLAVPVLVSRRPDWDKFPGADYTVAVDTLMPDGRTLQIGTAHHLGTNFAKTFEITYEDPEGEQQLVQQTCYGVSERCVAAVISVHGDDRGLILPPEVAPVQVVIIPILFGKDESILGAVEAVRRDLADAGYRVEVDLSDERPGAKFYKWEMKGTPLRIEIGPRDLKAGVVTMVRRDTGEKEQIVMDEVVPAVYKRFEAIHDNMLERATEQMMNRIYSVHTVDEARAMVREGIVRIPWCEEQRCGLEIEEFVGAGILGVPREIPGEEAICPICNKPTSTWVIMARAY